MGAIIAIQLKVGTFNLGIGHLNEILSIAIRRCHIVANPFVCGVTIHVVSIRNILYGIECKLTIVLGSLCGGCQTVRYHIVTTGHGIHMLGSVGPVGPSVRSLNLVGHQLSSSSDKDCQKHEDFSHGC